MNTAAPEEYVSDTGDFTGPPIEMWRGPVRTMSLHAVITGSLAGTYVVEASNVPDAGRHPTLVRWEDVSSLLTIPATSGMINFTFAGWAFVRLRLTGSTGTGTVEVYSHIVRG